MFRYLPVLLCLVLLSCQEQPGPSPPPTAPAAAQNDPAEPEPYVEEMTSEDQEHPPTGYYDSIANLRENYNPGQYDAIFRPEYHYTPKRGWMNDPNGLVHYAGEWHLFYQHFPAGNKWGPMHWGHAVSADLVNWEELEIALEPDDKGYIFSGSVVVDSRGLSPFAEDGGEPMIALFTYHDMAAEKAGRTDYESQGLAYSHDRGRTWIKYAGNPVIPNRGAKDFRDPKVFWDEKNDGYTMVLAAGDHVEFYTTKNFIDWTYLSSFGSDQAEQFGVWECPDLIRMPVHREKNYDGTYTPTGASAYTLIVSTNPGHVNGGGSGTYYYTGSWDGKNFTLLDESDVYNEPGTKWLDYGRDNYATVSFADVPDRDGRTLLLGWMSNWQYAQDVPTKGWRSAMTVPRNAILYYDPDFGYRLRQTPVRELRGLHGKRIDIGVDRFEDGITTIDLTGLENPGVLDLQLTVDLTASASEELYFTFHDEDNRQFYRFGLSRSQGWFTDRDQAGLAEFSDTFTSASLTKVPRFVNDGVVNIRLLLDRTSAELFLDGGRSVATDIFFPTKPFTFLTVEVSGGTAGLDGEFGFFVEDGVIRGM